MRMNSFTRVLKEGFEYLSEYEIKVVKSFMTSGEKQNKKSYVRYINYLYDSGKLLDLEYSALMSLYL